MFAVIVQIYGSAPRRIKARKLGMCVKGSGGFTGSFGGGLFFITLPTISNSTNQTGSWAPSLSTGFATPPPPTTRTTCKTYGLNKTEDGWEYHYADGGNITDSGVTVSSYTYPVTDQTNDITYLEAYEYGRPDDWDESEDGIWWGGLNVTKKTSDVDDDGSPENYMDTDNDSLPDSWELFWTDHSLDPKDNGTKTFSWDYDSLSFVSTGDGDTVNGPEGDRDKDGWNNTRELEEGTNPVSPDTDGDGMPDSYEIEHGLDHKDDGNVDPINGPDGDPDNDGIDNLDEYNYLKPNTWDPIDDGTYWGGTNVTHWDTDRDGMPDGYEREYGLDPNESADASEDADEDGMDNIEEYRYSASDSYIESEHYEEVDLEIEVNDTTYTRDLNRTKFSEAPYYYTGGTDLFDWDTDNDGMPDGYEYDCELKPLNNGTWAFGYNDTTDEFGPLSESLDHTFGPHNDTDNDTLTNLQEYEYGRPDDWNEETDGEWTGGLDATDPDTDGDYMPDGWEDQYGLDPNDPSASNDNDSDGLDDLQEYNYSYGSDSIPDEYDISEGGQGIAQIGSINHGWKLANGIYNGGLDPTKADTDQDGLSDQFEADHDGSVMVLNPDYDGSNSVLIERSTAGFNPLNPDTDNDTIQDGKEKDGYTAKYFYREGGETKNTTRTIDDADPLTAYKNDDGDWIDSDTDNIPDVIEQDPKNYSDLDDRTEHFWDEYKDKGNKTQQQFTPRTVEPFKPGLDKLDVETESGWTGTPGLSTREAWAEIMLHVNDTAGIDKIILENKDNNEDVTLYSSDGEELDDEPGVYKFETDLDIQYWNDYVADGWDLNITLIDENGNEFVKEKHVQSQFGNFIDVIGLGWVADALAEAAEAAKELGNAMLGYIKDKVGGYLGSALSWIGEGLKGWVKGIVDQMLILFEELNRWEDVDGNESVDAVLSSGLAFVLSFLGLQDKAEMVTDAMEQVSDFIAPFKDYISPYGIAGVFANVLGENIDAVGDFFGKIRSGISGALSKVIPKIIGLLMSEDNSLASALGLTNKTLDENLEIPSFNALRNFIIGSGISREGGVLPIILDSLQNIVTNDENSTQNSIMGSTISNAATAVAAVGGIISAIIWTLVRTGGIEPKPKEDYSGASFSITVESIGVIITIGSAMSEGVNKVIGSIISLAWTNIWFGWGLDNIIPIAFDGNIGSILAILSITEVSASWISYYSTV